MTERHEAWNPLGGVLREHSIRKLKNVAISCPALGDILKLDECHWLHLALYHPLNLRRCILSTSKTIGAQLPTGILTVGGDIG